MNTGWANIDHVPGATVSDTILLTWNQGFFNGPGIDFLIVCFNNSYSGKADVRLLLSDGTYTAIQTVNLISGMVVSTGGVMVLNYNNCLALQSSPIEMGLFVPAAKEIDIAAFYNGPLAIMGIEFTNPVNPNPDIITIAMTQNAVIQPGLSPQTNHTTISGCNNVSFNGTTYTASTTVTDTIRSVHNLDSVYNITHIVVTQVTAATHNATISSCSSVVFGGITYTSSTIVKDTIRSMHGCDSIYNITNIIITPVAATTHNATISSCSSVVFGGITYTSSTIVKDTIRNMHGCDSIYNITNIIITPVAATIHNATISSCSSVVFGGITYTSSTIVKDTIRSMQGCDSIYNITSVIIAPLVPAIHDTSMVGCGSVSFGGINYITSTVLSDTTRNNQGCDSIYKKIHIIVRNLLPVAKDTTITGCGSIVFHNTVYTSSQSVIDTVRTIEGCDSLFLRANINISPGNFDPVLVSTANNVNPGTVVGLSISSPVGYDVIAWEPIRLFPLQHLAQQTIVADTSVAISVKLKSISGCMGTADLSLSVNKQIDAVYFPSAFYPNSTAGNNHFGPLGNLSKLSNYTLSIYNRWGTLVFSSTDPYLKWNGSYKGVPTEPGTFVWQASYYFKGIPQTLRTGYVVLLK